MKRELRDELEVPGHIMSYRPVNVKQIISEIKQILDECEKQGVKNLRDMPEDGKQRLIKRLDQLGVPHNGLR